MPKEKLDLVISVMAATIFVLLLMTAAFLLFRIYLKKKNRLLRKNEQMAQEFEQTLLRSKLEIQEQTFTHISREIHDNIGQVLSLIRINLNTLNKKEESEKMELMDELMGKAITDLRNLSHSLDTDLIRNAGWIKATERLLTDIQRSGNFKTSFQAEENLPTLGNEKPIILYRMIQEITNNIIRHAQAGNISFRALKNDNRIIIEITDDGKGFDTSAASAGAGLHNLSSRARMINAEIHIQSKPQNGTHVTISINTSTHE